MATLLRLPAKHCIAAATAVLSVTIWGMLGLSAQEAPQKALTFVSDVAPILREHCITCHQPGEMAPMSLVTFNEVRPWARAIRNQVLQRRMPPWFADPAVGHFSNDSRLSDEEVHAIAGWVDSGAARGEGIDPRAEPNEEVWKIGTPDLVLTLDEPFEIPARGVVEYQYFKLPTNLTSDRWIQAIEIRPTNRQSVHHLRVFAQPPNAPVPTADPKRPLCPEDACGDLEPLLSGFGPNIGSIAVGTQPIVFPGGTAKLLRAGSVVSLHVHYVTTGVPVRDRTQIGFVFAKTAPPVELRTLSLAQEKFVIPPYTPDLPVVASAVFQVAGRLWSLGPHSHLRGKSWRFELIDPRGDRRPLLVIPKYDFNWQLYYDFEVPVPFEPGSRLEATAVFDNSRENKNNPDPSVPVTWGPESVDEMMFASVTYSVDPPSAERLPK
jgi:hypothetical protein